MRNLSDGEIDDLCKQYHIEKFYHEKVYSIPREIPPGEIGSFLQKIRDLQEEHGEILIEQDWYNSKLQVYKMISKSKSDLLEEIKREIRNEEDRAERDLEDALENLREWRSEYPQLNITFTDRDS